MKYLIIIFFMIFTAEVSAQDTSVVRVHNSVLQVGEMLNFGAGSVKFKEVISDSRCPTGVTCIWAGEAIVRVEIYKNGFFQKEKIVKVGDGVIPLDLIAEGMSFNLAGLVLTPYPDVETKDKPLNYSLRVQVNEITEGN